MNTCLLPPAEQVEDGPYELQLLKTPTLTGWKLRLFTSLIESPVGRLLYPIIAYQSGVSQVLNNIKVPDPPSFLPDLPIVPNDVEAGCVPLDSSSGSESVEQLIKDGFLPGFGSGSRPSGNASGRPTVSDYAQAYAEGKTTPIEVADRIIAYLKASEARRPSCAWFVAWSEEDIKQQARDSAERVRTKSPRSVLEGVPFALKDLADAQPYPTTVGTSFMASRRPAGKDAPYVQALKGMGAIFLGKTNMHEIGLGITGLNLRTGTARNPHNLDHFCGGSSSGTAAVIAAGLCPFAIGTDGGGSIRIPSSFTGIVGLKPTNGRVTGAGGVEIDCTVATYGPMAGSVADCMLLYAVLANHDQWYALSGEPLPVPQLPKPLPAASTSGGRPLEGAKMGIYWKWFEDADAEVVASCRRAVRLLQQQGMAMSSVVIPELEHLRVALNVTIVSEMMHNMKDVYNNPATRGDFNADVRLALSIVQFWTPADYIHCQRLRTRGTCHFRRVFEQVDVIVTPTTPCTAPYISHAAATSGCSDLGLASKVMRFSGQANMLGLPAIAVPVGYDKQGLPISLQLIGRPWQEGTLLRLAAVLESAIQQQVGPLPAPKVFLNPITGAAAGLQL